MHSNLQGFHCYGSLTTVPKKPPRPCPVPGCPTLLHGADDCPRHPRPKRHKFDRRPSASQRGYGAEHQRKRDALLKRKPWCEDPFKRHGGRRVRSTVRDHVVPLQVGGTDNESNEQALCSSCNTYKSYRDGSHKSKGRAV